MTTLDLGFGFNYAKFSDRILRLVILPRAVDHDKPNDDHDKPNEHGECQETVCDKQLQSLEDSRQKETSCDDLHHLAFEEKYIYVNSVLLARHSPFFLKLFTNGMKETWERQATIPIGASEEAAFMDMLKFVYCGYISSATQAELLQLLMIADKFCVASCVNLCSQFLNALPMTIEIAMAYLALDCNGMIDDSLKQGIDKAKEFLPGYFRDVLGARFKEVLRLPLAGFEVVLSSDCLLIDSEDEIYDVIDVWVQNNLPYEVEGQRKMLNMLLHKYLRFPFVSSRKLQTILSSVDIDRDVASELALGSLHYHLGQPPQKQNRSKFIERAYKHCPLKVVAFGELSSRPQCTVYLDLKRVDILEKMILSGGHLRSQNFFLGEHELAFYIHCTEQRCFDFFIDVCNHEVSKATGFTFSCEIAAVGNPSGYFVVKPGKHNIFTLPVKEQMCGWRNLFSTTWERFISPDSPVFIDGILRLRCDLRIVLENGVTEDYQIQRIINFLM